MSEETTFLAALQANPADDTTRLVYADWLDEHAESAKAEYLRAVVLLTQHPGGSAGYTEAATRLYCVCGQTEYLWRTAAGGRFDVMLEGYDPGYKVHAIKIIREQTGCGLGEAKALSESVPTTLGSWLLFEQALQRLLAFHAPQWKDPNPFRASLRPTAWPEGGAGAVFDVVLTAIDLGGDNLPTSYGV